MGFRGVRGPWRNTAPANDRVFSDWNPLIGVHTDDALGQVTPSWLNGSLAFAGVSSKNFNRAPIRFKHKSFNLTLNPGAPYTRVQPWLSNAVALNAEIHIHWAPFGQQAGYGDPAVTAAFLDGLQNFITLYEPIVGMTDEAVWLLGNHNSNTWSGTDADWFTLEAAGLVALQARGKRVAVSTDKGIAWTAQTMVARRAAWVAAGVDLSGIEYIAFQPYTESGFVSVHLHLAQDMVNRVFASDALTIPVAMSEYAWDFIHLDAPGNSIFNGLPKNTRAGRPDMFADSGPNPSLGSGDFPYRAAVTHTDWVFKFCRREGYMLTYFEFPMMGDNQGGPAAPNLLGRAWLDAATSSALFVSPTPAEVSALLINTEPPDTYAFNLANAEATAFNAAYFGWPDSTNPPSPTAGGPDNRAWLFGAAAAARITAGYIFDRGPAVY